MQVNGVDGDNLNPSSFSCAYISNKFLIYLLTYTKKLFEQFSYGIKMLDDLGTQISLYFHAESLLLSLPERGSDFFQKNITCIKVPSYHYSLLSWSSDRLKRGAASATAVVSGWVKGLGCTEI